MIEKLGWVAKANIGITPQLRVSLHRSRKSQNTGPNSNHGVRKPLLYSSISKYFTIEYTCFWNSVVRATYNTGARFVELPHFPLYKRQLKAFSLVVTRTSDKQTDRLYENQYLRSKEYRKPPSYGQSACPCVPKWYVFHHLCVATIQC